MRAPEPLKLTPDEQDLLKLAEESESFIRHPLWKKIEIFLQANVEEALEQIRSNASHDPNVALHFQRIWREREQLRDSLIVFVKAPIKEKRELMDQIEKAKQEGMIYA
jgi:shikimate kinase